MEGMGGPWTAAARSLIADGPVRPDQLDGDVHCRQHPACAAAGRREVVFSACCGTRIPLPRPMWLCEIPWDTGADCCLG